MSYPDIEALPDWVCWLAQDADGTWWGYEVEPNQQHRGWYENEVGRSLRLLQGAPEMNWRQTVQKVR